MNQTIRTTRSLLIIYYLITLHVAAVYFVIDKVSQHYVIEPRPPIQETQAANSEPTPAATVSEVANTVEPTAAATANAPVSVPPQLANGLIVPVAGVKPGQLTDSFTDARSEGRVHDALDIPAPAGTPVLAAADGKIARFWDSARGGITIYQLSMDEKIIYYYAHLQRRAEDIKVGDVVKQGKVIGYVGDTGNAGTGNNHLHFAMSQVTDPQRFWEGTPINPFPLLNR